MKELFKNKKILIGLLTTVIVLILSIGGVIYFSSNAKDKNKAENQNQIGETYLVIEINPKLMLHLDEDGTVIEVFQLNEDAYIFTNDDLKDLDLDKALDKIIEIAQNNGYFEDDKDISITILTNENENEEYLDIAFETLVKRELNVKKKDLNEEQQEEIKKITENYHENKEGNKAEGNDKESDKDNKTVENQPDNSDTNNQTAESQTENTNTNKTTEKEVVVEEKIQFASTTENEVNMLRGTSKVVQPGQEGIKRITYKVTYDSSGKEISRSKSAETISKQAVNQISKIGISDFNLNTDTLDGVMGGDVCFDSNLISVDGYIGCDEPNNISEGGYFSAISLSGTFYLIKFKDIGNYEALLYNQGALIKLNKVGDTFLYKGVFDGVWYNFCPHHGDATVEPLTENICSKYSLACGRW